jgi:hypothetical protein
MTSPWQKLYDNPRWRARSKQQLRHHPLCAFCLQEGHVTQAKVADHVIAHHGDQHLFFYGALQSLCWPHHNSTKQQVEQIGYSKDIGLDGWPIDANHPANRPSPKLQYSIPYGLRPSAIPVTLVCGPPAAGKSTWVKARAKCFDTVIDLDECKLAVGGKAWDGDKGIIKKALRHRDQLLHALHHKHAHRGRAYVIVGAPTMAERVAWMKALGIPHTPSVEGSGVTPSPSPHGEVVVLNVPAETCIARLKADPERREVVQRQVLAVLEWHRLCCSATNSV